MLDLAIITHYTLSMKRGGRYIGVIDGKRYWSALECGHPVANYQTKRCQKCWFKSEDRKQAITKKRTYKYTGQLHHSWKGGRIVDSGGYIKVRVDNKYVFEHRLVMEQHLGRLLNPKEEVHHINHIKSDNRIENLMLFANHAEHIKFEHSEGERKFSR